jgi:eukaryotic-like serine/threonine-protein kinase
LIGQRISHYRVLEKLGGGGMGEVYEAEDTRLGRRVALKFLPAHLSGDQLALDRFQREACAASRLNHANICTIHDIAANEGQPFLVMELLEGTNVKDRILQGPLPIEQVLDIGIQVADALEAAHAHGIIHRDLKPGNICITERGQAKVLDFGLAKLIAAPTIAEPVLAGPAPDPSDPTLTAMGIIPGTAAYMSPEQIQGLELDARSDLFSLGLVLYEMATGQRPFPAANTVLTMAAILERRPVSPLAVNPSLPPGFEVIVGKALEKDRNLRYQTAAEMRADLEQLKRQIELPSRAASSALPAARSRVFRRKSPWWQWVALGVGALLVTTLAVVALWWVRQGRARMGPAARSSIAVLPFQNVGGDPASDYLRMALSDQISTILTYTPSLEVRPVQSSAKFLNAASDPRQIGRDLKVGKLITGHFIRESNDLLVTIEAIDVKDDRLLWQGTINVPFGDSLALEKQLAGAIRQRLLPLLGGSARIQTATRPTNAEAYDLFLRSASVSHDPAPNQQAISMLQRSVQLDPSYAPAWDALGFRYYYEATYGTGGQEMFTRAGEAYQHALQLDPNFMTASAHLARNWAESGDLARAYDEARALVARRPDDAQAHFTLSYVLRYAGRLPEAGRECDTALSLDPGDYLFRSCAIPFFQQGNVQRAMDYLALDAGSDWTTDMTPSVLLRTGDVNSARQAAAIMTDQTNGPPWFTLLQQACMARKPQAQIAALVAQAEPAMSAQRDPEFRYLQGSLLAWCGQKNAAFSILTSAIRQNYCATVALDKDPLLAALRSDPAFAALKQESQACSSKFQIR